jgi:Kef-type K+ transport system membrane component KefB
MAGVPWEHMAGVVLFLYSIWMLGRLFRACRLPAILGELLAGILLGPNVLDLVPFASDGRCPGISFERRRLAAEASADGGEHDCRAILVWVGDHLMDVWSFVGTVGVTLLIMESGMHINFEKVRLVGMKASVVAVVGTVAPLLIGMGLTALFFPGRLYPDGFAAGCALAPTSVGISIKLLDDAKMLDSLAGQTTLTAAFIDDVFSLVLLVVLGLLPAGLDIGTVVIKTALAFGFLGLGVVLAHFAYPHLGKLFKRIPEVSSASIQPRDELQVFIMLTSLVFFAYIGSLIGSHLLGAFVAGMCFVNVPKSHQIWSHQLKRIVRWFIRIFFAATVGFAVPVQTMLTAEAFGRGAALGIFGGVLGKLVSGLPARTTLLGEKKRISSRASFATRGNVVQPVQYLVGVAMVARGEFAFLVAFSARNMRLSVGDSVATNATGASDESGSGAGTSSGLSASEEQYMLSPDVYATVTWALLWALVSSPFLFKWALQVYARASPVVRGTMIGGQTQSGRDFKIRITGQHHTGVLHEILDLLHVEGLDVIDGQSSRNLSGVDVNIYTVRSRGKQKDYDDEKLEMIKHHLQELVGDTSSVSFETTRTVADLNASFSKQNARWERDRMVEHNRRSSSPEVHHYHPKPRVGISTDVPIPLIV